MDAAQAVLTPKEASTCPELASTKGKKKPAPAPKKVALGLTPEQLQLAWTHMQRALETIYGREAFVQHQAGVVRRLMNDRKGARVYFERGLKANYPGADLHYDTVDLLIEMRDFPAARAALDVGVERTGDGDFFRPMQIRYALRTKSGEDTAAMYVACEATGRDDVIARCRAVCDGDVESKVAAEEGKETVSLEVLLSAWSTEKRKYSQVV